MVLRTRQKAICLGCELINRCFIMLTLQQAGTIDMNSQSDIMASFEEML